MNTNTTNDNDRNVALWLYNDEPLYNMVMLAVLDSETPDEAARKLLTRLHNMQLYSTPDGVTYNTTRIKAAIEEEFTDK